MRQNEADQLHIHVHVYVNILYVHCMCAMPKVIYMHECTGASQAQETRYGSPQDFQQYCWPRCIPHHSQAGPVPILPAALPWEPDAVPPPTAARLPAPPQAGLTGYQKRRWPLVRSLPPQTWAGGTL